MTHPHPATPLVIGGGTAFSAIAQFPVVCFTLALLTDLAYWRTANLMWQHFSSWLLFAGLVIGVLAVLAGIIELFVPSSRRTLRARWPWILGVLIALALAIVNSLIHAGDGWRAVVPWGLTLSVVTVLVLLAGALFGWSRRSVHVSE